MPVSNISDTYGNVFQGHSTETVKEDPMGRDAFLKMLVAQMENQDPLNPLDGTDFTAQLAQFSSLEQLFDMNDGLESLTAALQPQDNENVLDYIGKQIMSEDDTLALKGGRVLGGSFTLDQPKDVIVRLYDDVGREISTLYPGTLAAGTHQIEWNGTDRLGNRVPDGQYRFALAAVEEGGVHESIKAATSGTVTGVVYEDGTPFLEVDDRLVDPASVTRVWMTG